MKRAKPVRRKTLLDGFRRSRTSVSVWKIGYCCRLTRL